MPDISPSLGFLAGIGLGTIIFIVIVCLVAVFGDD